MIIRGIHIENFGHFHDYALELRPGLNRIRGENEFGKSTLVEFIRRVLWGFPDGRRSQLNRYPARFSSGEYGGWLDIELADGRRVKLERFGLKGRSVVRMPDGGTEDGEEWLRRLSPVSGDCYRNVYAVTLDELAHLADLESDEIRGRLYGGAITGEGVSLPQLGKLLDERARTLYKQRNGASRINTARQELRDAAKELDDALNRGARRAELERELAASAEKEHSLREAAAEVAAAAGETELLLRAYPFYAECREIESKLAAFPPSAEVRETEAAEAAALEFSLSTAERSLPPPVTAEECAKLERELSDADAELARLASGVVPLPEPADHAAARELAEGRVAAAPLFSLRTLAAAAFAAAGAFAAVVTDGMPRRCAAAVVLLSAVSACVFLVRRAKALRRREAWRVRCDGFSAKFGLVCPPEKFPEALELRMKRERLASELDSRRAGLAAHAAVGELRDRLSRLCSRHGCRSAEELRLLADRFAERNKLRRELARNSAMLESLLGAASGARPEALRDFDPAAAKERLAGLDREAGELKRSAGLLQRQSGALHNELEHLPQDGELELRRSMVESARGEIAAAVREFLVVRGCRRLLDAAVARYEKESQPEVLKRAAELFSRFTSGRYPRLYRELSSGELIVCDAATGLEKNFSALSRGTREELMIAMRLALIECTERGAEPLPVVFDDVGVNFDPRRLAAAEEAVAEFSAGRQVIWLSHS